MRCLYCGKELAILKKLTGGGEFCSESHRQSYHDEYNRLALSRLLQAQSRSDETVAGPPRPAAPVPPSKVVVEELAPPPAAPPQPAPPPFAGFCADQPRPHNFEVAAGETRILQPANAMSEPPQPEFPSRTVGAQTPAVEWASSVSWDVGIKVRNCDFPSRSQRVQAASFPDPRLTINVKINPISNEKQLDIYRGTLAMELDPAATEGLPKILEENGFEYPLELLFAESASLQFVTTGFELPELVESYVGTEADFSPIVAAPEKTAPVRPHVIASPVEVEPEPEPVPAAFAPEVEEEVEEAPPIVGVAEAPPTAIEAKPLAIEPLVAEPFVSKKAEPEAKVQEEKPAEAGSPREVTDLAALSLRGAAPQKGKLQQSFQAIAVTSFRMSLPRLSALPFRPKMAYAPKPAAKPDDKVEVNPETKPDPHKVSPKPAEPAAKPPEVKIAAKKPEVRVPARPQAAPNRPTPATPPSSREMLPKREAPPPLEAAASTREPAREATMPETMKEATKEGIKLRPLPGRPPGLQQGGIPQRDRAATAPATLNEEPEAPEMPAQSAPQMRPRLVPIRKPDSAAPEAEPSAPEAPAAAAEVIAPALMMEGPKLGEIGSSPWSRLPVVVRIGLVLLIAAGIALYFYLSRAKTTQASAGDGVGASIMMGEGGWSRDWASDASGSHKARQIDIYRPSLDLSDYRLEFQGQIESKSMGWVFRAVDSRNYYAMKLEITRPGISPSVSLVHFAVIDGEETTRSSTPLSAPVRMDTVYHVRFDVRGSKFATTVQGEPVDLWTDDRLKKGGVGFFNERGERGNVKSVQISYLNSGTSR